MSFGNSGAMRFQASTGADKKPVIFWEQQASGSKKKKKYPYKGKVQQYPLRNNQQPAEPEEPLPKPKKDIIKRNVKNASVKKDERKAAEKEKKDTKKDDYVTLTQNQFDKILETIGELTIAAEQHEKGTQDVAQETKNKPDSPPLEPIPLPPDSPPLEPVPLDSPAQTARTEKQTARSRHQQAENTTPFQPQPSENTVQPAPKAPLTKAEKKKLEWQQQLEEQKRLEKEAEAIAARSKSQQRVYQTPTLPPTQSSQPPKQHQETKSTDQNSPGRALATSREHLLLEHQIKQLKEQLEQQKYSNLQQEQRQQPAQQQQQQQQQPAQERPQQQQQQPTQQQVKVAAPMSKAELKRLQWNKERAEQQTDWNPWGRPGAGAPPASVNQPQPQTQPPQTQAPQTTTANTTQAPATNNYTTAGHVYSEPVAVPGLANITPRAQTDEPAAIRSSFMIGVAAPNEDRFADVKERQRKQWLKELEQQREEQRLKKQQEKQQYSGEPDTWADRMTGPQNSRPQDTQPVRVTSAPLDGLSSTGQMTERGGGGAPTAFIRGQNAMVVVDPLTLQQLDEKRKKQQEHQEFIRLQMQEKELLKQAEKEKKRREELEEEEKMKKARDDIQRQYEVEQQKARTKEEKQRRQVELLKQTIDEAAERAEREKHRQRLLKLQQGGHDISHLHASFEAKNTPRDNASSLGAAPLSVRAPSVQAPSSIRYGTTGEAILSEPAYIPGLSDFADLPPPSVPPYQQPSNFQQTYTLQQREAESKEALRREISTPEIEYSGRIDDRPSRPREKPQKKVRVQSAADEDKVSVTNRRRKKPVPINQRPKWGTKAPVYKQPKKQSERDPFYEKKKQRLEATKVQRAAELKRLTHANSPRIPEVQTIASRNRSRSRDRSPDPVPHSRSPGPIRKIEYTDTPQGNSSRSKHVGSVNIHRGQHNTVAPSPAVPSIRNHLRLEDGQEYNFNQHARSSSRPEAKHIESAMKGANHERYYGTENRPADPPSDRSRHYRDRDDDKPREDFAPFIRTQDILDPARADEPMPLSREATQVQRGRRQYRQELDPARYGTEMRNFDDPRRQQQYDMALEGRNDPIMNPSLVTEHPSQRQNRILQQLNELRKGLAQKQREVEMNLPIQAAEEM